MQAGPSIGTPTKHNGFGCPEALRGEGGGGVGKLRKPGQPRNPKPKARHTMYVQHPKPTESRRAVCAVPPRQCIKLAMSRPMPRLRTLIDVSCIYLAHTA